MVNYFQYFDCQATDDGIIIGLAILFSILTLALLCTIISLYHYKKKTKAGVLYFQRIVKENKNYFFPQHYHSVVHWYENIRPKKVRT